jgi:hypothetical protein
MTKELSVCHVPRASPCVRRAWTGVGFADVVSCFRFVLEHSCLAA